jgi:hypothetical protein
LASSFRSIVTLRLVLLRGPRTFSHAFVVSFESLDFPRMRQ